ncbi:MAG TPA: TetR/AcrR family transcriptional regulator C-terminal domain-containing protein [Glaciibacter sp.]|nr:TetR/AcrR family transcriptional regulator C-terminal domain-containing protein [Glaciibacter sp.]
MRESEPSQGASIDRGQAIRQALDRRKVIDAAVAYVDRNGLRQLTMRSLGAELGVEAMSLYRYVPGREDLLEGILEAVIDELYGDPEVLLSARGNWQDYLQRLAHGVRRLALHHPNLFPLVATRPPAAPWIRPPLRSLRWIDSFLDSLIASGFSDKAAVAAYRAFSSFLLGHLLLEVAAAGAAIGPSDDDEFSAPEAVDLSDYPRLTQLQDYLSEDRSADEFEESLENLIDRLERLVRPS